jgi:glycosyltransferase involved in cell wall biosynthesis
MKSNPQPPSVSVIIPTFNRADLLGEALESVCRQELRGFEVIVVNDAGEDVLPLVRSFSERVNLSYIRLERNSGLPAARNAGVATSTCGYIALLDDDDIWMPQHLSRLAALLDRRPDIGLCYSDVLLDRQQLIDGLFTTKDQRVLAYDYDHETMMSDSFICPSSVMVRRECFTKLGGFDESMRWCYEDWDFFLKVATAYRIERSPGISVRIRLRESGDNMSSVVRPERLKAARILSMRYGVGEIEPKTFWEVAETLERKQQIASGTSAANADKSPLVVS